MGVIDNVIGDVGELLSPLISIKILVFRQQAGAGNPENKTYPPAEVKDPHIDVIETETSVKIVGVLPRIKREDVWYEVGKDLLTVEITWNCQVYRKEIALSPKPSHVHLKKMTINNSVLEMTFEKTGNAKKGARKTHGTSPRGTPSGRPAASA